MNELQLQLRELSDRMSDMERYFSSFINDNGFALHIRLLPDGTTEKVGIHPEIKYGETCALCKSKPMQGKVIYRDTGNDTRRPPVDVATPDTEHPRTDNIIESLLGHNKQCNCKLHRAIRNGLGHLGNDPNVQGFIEWFLNDGEEKEMQLMERERQLKIAVKALRKIAGSNNTCEHTDTARKAIPAIGPLPEGW